MSDVSSTSGEDEALMNTVIEAPSFSTPENFMLKNSYTPLNNTTHSGLLCTANPNVKKSQTIIPSFQHEVPVGVHGDQCPVPWAPQSTIPSLSFLANNTFSTVFPLWEKGHFNDGVMQKISLKCFSCIHGCLQQPLGHVPWIFKDLQEPPTPTSWTPSFKRLWNTLPSFQSVTTMFRFETQRYNWCHGLSLELFLQFTFSCAVAEIEAVVNYVLQQQQRQNALLHKATPQKSTSRCNPSAKAPKHHKSPHNRKHHSHR